MKVALLFRKKRPENNSIEELFNGIISYLSDKQLSVSKEMLRRSGVSYSALFYNLKQTSNLSYDLIHITGDVHYVALASTKPTVLTIHDIGSALNGNFLKQFFIKLIWFWLPAIRVNKITVISEFSKSELIKLIPFAKNKVVVIPNPVSTDLKFKTKVFNERCPKILQMGTKMNKNLERTIEAIKDIQCKLVIIGKLTENQERLLETNNINFENEYYIEYNRIINHYENSDIVCFASTYEGFGMPIIEAQKIGRPVVTSNVSSMPEVAGNGACLVNPYKSDEIKDAINKIINNQEYRDQLISAGLKNVERFSIKSIAHKYMKIYEEVLMGKSGI